MSFGGSFQLDQIFNMMEKRENLEHLPKPKT
jgi:hypothetical protein